MFGKEFARTQEHPINAALNYGYTILLSYFNREITANGYVTQLGLFHENRFNPFNLGSDLMEPYRPLVDEVVYCLNPERFETEEKHKILKLCEKQVMIAERKEFLDGAIKMYVRSVLEALNHKTFSQIKFYQNEL